jgi:hypothetical protein
VSSSPLVPSSSDESSLQRWLGCIEEGQPKLKSSSLLSLS